MFQLFHLEELRREKLHDLATLLQKTWRGWHARQHYLTMKYAQITIAAFFRMYSVSQIPYIYYPAA